MPGQDLPLGYEGNEMVQGIVIGKTNLFYFCSHDELLGVEYCHSEP